MGLIMIEKLNKKYLITTDDWFFAPDGESYKAVFGTITAIKNDKDILGIQTNRHSTDWYLSIGNMMIAGCQIHYCIQTDSVSSIPPTREIECEGKLTYEITKNSRIYMADK